ncbi:hypothetical protein J6590_094534 [Homalodisca vitripennis]|nr:hypothetical protein J6590_094534 [Homalodisca vitripennis]
MIVKVTSRSFVFNEHKENNQELCCGVSVGHRELHKIQRNVRIRFYWLELNEEVRQCTLRLVATGCTKQTKASMRQWNLGMLFNKFRSAHFEIVRGVTGISTVFRKTLGPAEEMVTQDPNGGRRSLSTQSMNNHR